MAGSTAQLTVPEAEENGLAPLPTDELLADVRALAVRSRNMLQKHGEGSLLATRQMVNFNMWAATSGVFRTGQQSLAARLKSSLEMSVLHQQLLLSLEACLCRSST